MHKKCKLHLLITFLCVLLPQCFASSAGAVLGLFWILCSTAPAAGAAMEQPEQYLVTPVSIQQKEVVIFQSHSTDGATKAKTTTDFLFK